MRLWLSKSSEVPLRDQLAAQVILGIVSDDLKAGQKLPSTRELARRYKVHANTVSAAYRRLALQGWVEFRKGSGVYVLAQTGQQEIAGHNPLDQLINVFLRTARDHGHSLPEIQSRLRHWLAIQPPDHFLFIEPDEELRRIVVAEIEEATGVRVIGVAPNECANADLLTGAAPVSLYGQAEAARTALRSDADLITIRARSVPESLKGEKHPAPDALIAIVSRWPEFLRWSYMILVAAGLDPDALSFRDAREKGWQKGLRSTALVIADSLVARQLPSGLRTRVFRIVSDSSLDNLRAFVQQFFS
ncbi:MAG TPA: GntR family transcriptional regulator [Pyrinomonadaceae bacterium]|nr:GntR family transcriptional regulator [Pyrinomonadaceae bacterium]